MEKALCYANQPLKDPEGITFSDSTLREGEGAPGVTFTDEEKQELVRRLDAIGVDAVKIAYVRLNPRLKKLSQDICAMDNRIKKVVQVSGKDPRSDEMLEYIADVNAPIVSVSWFIAPYGNHGRWDAETLESTRENIISMCEKIRGYGKEPIVSLIDATRADPDEMLLLAKTAAEAGAGCVTLADTAGCAAPEAIYEIFSRAVEAVSGRGARVGVHCHNDFGLCLANTLAGVRAGAKTICTTIDGLGERCGNASLVEVAAALEFLYGVKTGLDMQAMTELSRYVEQITRHPLPISKPLVGEDAFAHKQDVHLGELEFHPLAFTGIRPEEVGNEERIVFGKSTGPNGLTYMSKKRGVPIDPKYFGRITEVLTEMDEGNKGALIREEQFWAVVKAVQSGEK